MPSASTAGGTSGAAGTTSTTGGAAGSGAAAGKAGSMAGTAGVGGVSTAGTGGGGTAGGGGSAGQVGGGCSVDQDCAGKVPPTKPLDCAEAYCKQGVCAVRAKDADGDGSRTNKCLVTSDDLIVVELGKDCDDTNPKVNPAGWDGPAGEGHDSGCGDGVDQNCTGVDGDDVLASGASCACTPGDVAPCSETASGVPISFPGGSPAAGSVCTRGSKTCEKDVATGGKWGPCINAVSPGLEVCNGTDDDCDGETDEADAADPSDWVYDGDGDGQAALVPGVVPALPFASVKSCISRPPSQYPVECTDAYCGAIPKDTCCPKDAWRLGGAKTDCDDRAVSALAGGVEICGNDIDENCDGQKDEAGAVGEKDWAYDGDGDGSGDIGKGLVRKCTVPCVEATEPGCTAKWKTGIPATDCNDANAAISPKASENCSTKDIDENCNGNFFDQCTCVKDVSPALDCGVPGDCNYVPGGSTCVNGTYTACPAPVAKVEYCPDADGDGYCATDAGKCGLYCPSGDAAQAPPAGSIPRASCSVIGGSNDCQDGDTAINPNANELCGDGKDSNCRTTGVDSDSDTFNLGAVCTVQAPKGSAGACVNGGKLACLAAGSPSSKCSGPAAVGSSAPQSKPAPNGSWDWDCDGHATITQTQCLGASGFPCNCADYKFESDQAVTALAQWTPQNILLVSTPPLCGSFSSQLSCENRAFTHFYAVSCVSGKGCTPPSCGTALTPFACSWSEATNTCLNSRSAISCVPSKGVPSGSSKCN